MVNSNAPLHGCIYQHRPELTINQEIEQDGTHSIYVEVQRKTRPFVMPGLLRAHLMNTLLPHPISQSITLLTLPSNLAVAPSLMQRFRGGRMKAGASVRGVELTLEGSTLWEVLDTCDEATSFMSPMVYKSKRSESSLRTYSTLSPL